MTQCDAVKTQWVAVMTQCETVRTLVDVDEKFWKVGKT